MPDAVLSAVGVLVQLRRSFRSGPVLRLLGLVTGYPVFEFGGLLHNVGA